MQQFFTIVVATITPHSDNLFRFIAAAVMAASPLLFGTVGEILTEKSGNLNLGVEGMMFMGGAGGLAGAYFYEQMSGNPIGLVSVLAAILCAFLSAALGAAIYAVLCIGFRANQNVTGLALTMFGVGVGNFVGEALGKAAGGYVTISSAAKAVYAARLPLGGIPVLGPLLFSYNFVTYLAFFIAIFLVFFFKKTKGGLRLRAVGENPSTAASAGIRVNRSKYLATILGGGLTGLGGLYIVMIQNNGVWVHNAISGKGWISVALVIFVLWSPGRAMWGSVVFGALSVLRLYYPMGGESLIPLYDVLPYLATVAVLIFVSRSKSNSLRPPAALGISEQAER